jgi:uncharacterized Zn-binding protein involved in type VI secretion
MSQPFIVIGDQTDHGGQVVEGSPTSTTGGKSIARVGDRVTCPKHNHGPTTIVSGDETMLIDGRPAARHGDKCACGATLIASQYVSTAGGSGAGSSADSSQPPASASNSSTLVSDSGGSDGGGQPAAGSQSAESAAYDEQVKLSCQAGQQLPVGMPWCVVLPSGELNFGRVDASGLLPRIATGNQVAEYHILWGDEALEIMQ